jgi:AcrR family transcriptional regulator
MEERRRILGQKVLEYLLANGVAGLSLRPLAAATGTSARLLVYHFGSKEGLITSVMDEVQAQFQTSLAASLARRPTSSAHPLRFFWASLIRPAHLRYVRLLFEAQVLALQRSSLFARYLDRTSRSWLDLVEGALPPSRHRRALATLYVSVIDGLLLELLSTGDRRRTTAALELFLAAQVKARTT